MSYPYVGDIIYQWFGVQWNIPIPTFGLFVATGVIFSVLFLKKEVKRLASLGKLSRAKIHSRSDSSQPITPVENIVPDLAMYSTLSGIIGARLFHVLENTDFYLSNPADVVFSQGGFSIFGGLIFGVTTGIYFLKKRQIPVLPLLDAVAPALMLGYGIGRIGCQLSGDGDWGIASNMSLKPDWVPNALWAQTYENNIVGVVIQPPGVYPTPIYESLLAFCIFFILLVMRNTNYQTGFLFSLYLLLSGLERYCIEKIRINNEYHLLGLDFTQAELISSVLIILGLIGIFKTTGHNRLPKFAYPILAVLALSACTIL